MIKELKEGQKIKRKTLADYQEELGGPGVFQFPWREHSILKKEEWKYDLVPEIIDGKNIFDYVDPEIETKLEELEREEEQFGDLENESLLDEETIENAIELEKVR